MATKILIKILWLYGGAFVPIVMAKLNIVQLDDQTNIVTFILIFLIIGTATLLLNGMGY